MKTYRCLLKKNDDSLILTIVFFVLFTLMSYKIIPAFFSEEFLLYSDFKKMFCIVCASFLFLPTVIGEVISIRFNLRAAEKWHVLSDGLHGRSPLGKERFVSWAEIQDACICELYGAKGKPIRVIRFSTDKAADDKLRTENRKSGLGKGWPRWLDFDYNFRNYKRIIIIEYLPELEMECRKYFSLR